MIWLLILTGQRRSEVAGMRWGELDIDAGLWSLPSFRWQKITDLISALIATRR